MATATATARATAARALTLVEPGKELEMGKSAPKKRAKRANGEGCIYPWPGRPGKFRGRFTIGGKVVSFSGDSERAVQKKADQAAADFARGIRADKKYVTVGEYLTNWLEGRRTGVVGAPLGERTLPLYARQLSLHILPELGDIKLKELEPERIRRFLREKAQTQGQTQGAARASLRLMLAVLKQGLEQAAEDKYFARSPAANIRIPSTADWRAHGGQGADGNGNGDEDVTILEPDELERLMAALPRRFPYSGYATDKPYHLMFRLLLATGMRQGELRGLRWRDLDFTRRQIAIRQQVYRLHGAWQTGPVKNRNSRRVVGNLPADVWTLLESHRAAIERYRAQSPYAPLLTGPMPDLVFLSRNGLPIDDKHFRVMWEQLLTAADIARHVKVHNTRHTHGSYLLYARWPAIRVALRLGHKDVSMLEETYAGALNHVSQQRIRAVLPYLINAVDDDEAAEAAGGAVAETDDTDDMAV